MKKFPDKQPEEFQEGQSVELLICDPTEIGYKAIISNSRIGVLYKNEVFQPLRKGQRITGFIKKVRDDGKIDLCLQKPGYDTIDFGVSKKTFKKAIGALYKKRLITIESNGIRLIEK
ncbi:MAG: hypothetical protein HZC48_09495 [Nitrospirae bacterium]|nr:hypothetical protein [Nitrospirota bacterium]